MRFAIVVGVMFLGAGVAQVILGQRPLPPNIEVQCRIIVEPSYPSPFPEELTLDFENVAGNGGVSEITVGESIKTTSFTPVRGGMTGQSRLQKDGKFIVLLPPSQRESRLIVRIRPSSGASPPNSDRYFVKAIQAGGANLLEKPFVVSSSSLTGEILITIEKCTGQTQIQCR